jgi:hypothetical protein
MPHLILLGTSHLLQCAHGTVPPASIAAFEAEIVRLIDHYAIQRVAEEMSVDGLTRYGVSSTVAERIAATRQLDHHQIDIGNAERNALSANDAALGTILHLYQPADGGQGFRDTISILDHELRERVWIYRLLSRSTTPVLFICGSDHVAPVSRLWQLLGLKAEIAHRDYGV